MQVGSYTIQNHLLLIKAISGSRAYGLATETSDTDIKGVFVQPKHEFYGLETIEQANNETNDIVFYELKKFCELLYKNNPNIIELLGTPVDCILHKHPLFDKIQSEKILSKQCKQTFVLYAEAQIKKAKGLNKKIVNPIEKDRKSIAHFCYVVSGSSTIPLHQWLQENNFSQADCGLVALNHMRDVFAVFHNSQAVNSILKGIYSGEDANDVLLSSVPKGISPIAIMSFNKDGYSVYCREYKEYWDWVEKRNQNRYQHTTHESKNYDAKNMMHVFRLLDVAEGIAKHQTVEVRSRNRGFLLDIKRGVFEYDYLLAQALEKIDTVNHLFDNSALPPEPDKVYINNLLLELREAFYTTNK